MSLSKRISQLENRTETEAIPSIFCFFVQPNSDIDGWQHDGVTHWRMPQETAADLLNRIKKIVPSTPGEPVLLYSATRDNEFTD